VDDWRRGSAVRPPRWTGGMLLACSLILPADRALAYPLMVIWHNVTHPAQDVQ
jgi:hypothetical protein